MSKRKIEVKVNMHCQKCTTEVLKSVTKLEGIDEVSVNLEKQTLVVIGDVDPVSVVSRVRKIGKVAVIVSVGPPKKPDPKPEPCSFIYAHPVCNELYPTITLEYPQPCNVGGCFIL